MSTACHTAPVEAVNPKYALSLLFLRNEAADSGTDSNGVVMSSTKTGARTCVSALCRQCSAATHL